MWPEEIRGGETLPFSCFSAEDAKRSFLCHPSPCPAGGPPPGCFPRHGAFPILNQTLNQIHEMAVKHDKNTLITGTETWFYYHRGRGRALFPVMI